MNYVFHVSLLFSGLLIHGCILEELSISTVISIQKGKHANMTNSNNYRGIALSSMFNKLFDLILLSRYYDKLFRVIYSLALSLKGQLTCAPWF